MKKLFIITPDASLPHGHEQHYTQLLIDAATEKGWSTATLWTANGATLPTTPLPSLPMRAVNRLRHGLARSRRIAAFRDLFTHHGAENVRFILHTATYDDLGLVTRGFALAAQRKKLGRLVIVLRYEHYDDEQTQAFIRHALTPAARAPIDVFADSVDLCELLAPLAPVPIELVRPPIAVLPWHGRRSPLLGYFGARRALKGFGHLPTAIAVVSAQRADARTFVQCYRHPHDEADPATEAALDRLRAMPQVDLVDAPLSAADYQERLRRCAVILVPYNARHYRAGTSGVFVEAVASGAAVLTTKGTWMAKEAKRHGLTRVFACDWDDVGTAGALALAALSIGLEPWQPTSAECHWIADHAPAALLARLVGQAQ